MDPGWIVDHTSSLSSSTPSSIIITITHHHHPAPQPPSLITLHSPVHPQNKIDWAIVRVRITVTTVSTAQLHAAPAHNRTCTPSSGLMSTRARLRFASIVHNLSLLFSVSIVFVRNPTAVNIHVVYKDSHYFHRPHPHQPSPPLRCRLLSRSAKLQFSGSISYAI